MVLQRLKKLQFEHFRQILFKTIATATVKTKYIMLKGLNKSFSMRQTLSVTQTERTGDNYYAKVVRIRKENKVCCQTEKRLFKMAEIIMK